MPIKISRIVPAIAVAFSLFATVAPAQAEGDVANGEQLFKRCASCHKIGEDARNASGPVLTDVIGRVAGTYEGFRFSDALIAAGEAGLVWDEENLAEYIADPRAFIRTFLDDPSARIKMSFKIRKEDEREDIAAFLASLVE